MALNLWVCFLISISCTLHPVDPCVTNGTNSCDNGGECAVQSNLVDFRCECTNGWIGKRCHRGNKTEAYVKYKRIRLYCY